MKDILATGVAGDSASPTQIFQIKTVHASVVVVSPESRLLRHSKTADGIPFVAFALAPADALIFIAADGHPFKISMGPFRRETSVLLLRPGPTPDRDRVALTDVISSLLLSAGPSGELIANREAVDLWETFYVQPADLDDETHARVIHRFRSLETRIEKLMAGGDSPLDSGESLREIVDCATSFMTAGILEPILKWAEHQTEFSGWLRLLDAVDPWLKSCEHALPQWEIRRRSSSEHLRTSATNRLKDETIGFLDNTGSEGRLVSPGHVLSKIKRHQVEPRRTACIITTVRNEGPYLIDWIGYHRHLGFDRIFIYSNDNDDGSDEVLRILDDHDEITWLPNPTQPNHSPQYTAYGHAFGVYPDVLDFEWALAIDLDEYVVLDLSAFPSVADFVTWHSKRGADAIALTWLLFGCNRQARWSIAPVTERFTKRSFYGRSLVKSFSKPRITSHSHCHFPWPNRLYPFTMVDAGGSAHRGVGDGPLAKAEMRQPIEEYAWINHYFYKSAEEQIWRRSYSGGGQSLQSGLHVTNEIAVRFNADFHSTESVDDFRIAPAFTSSLPVRQRLLAIPGLKEAMERVLVEFRRNANQSVLSNLNSDDPAVRQMAGLALSLPLSFD